MFKISVLLAALSVPVAFAQTGPFFCNTSAASQPLVRSEGVAELVADILLTCTGGVSGSAGTANITVYLNGTVTSRIVSSGVSEALLLIDELSTTPTVGINVIQGVVSGGSVTFFNVPVQQPGSGTRTFRITNLRVNANGVTGGGGTPAAIVAAIAVSGNTSIPIVNATLTVGIATPGDTFTAQDAQGGLVTSLAFQNAPQNAALLTNPAATGGVVTHQLKFTEGFNYSFRKRNTATSVANPTAIADQGTPGALNYTETGFYLSSLPSADGLNVAGLATQGTRLTAHFNNVPAGVALYVTTAPLPNTGATSATLVSTDASGGGSYSAVVPSASINVGGTAVGIAPVAISNGIGIASWEVLDADPSVVESYTFGVVAAYQSSSSSNAAIAGTLGPIAPVSEFQADATSPVPRFADTSTASLACATTPCLIAVPRGLPLYYLTGTPAPSPFNIQLDTTPTEAMPYQVSVSASQAGWITVSASAGGASGFTPDHLVVTITPGNLPPGAYQASIVVSSPTAQFAAITIPVVLTVTLGPSGYSPLACTAQAAITPLVRNSGMAERVGDVLLTCTGGTPTASGSPVPAYDVQLTLTTPVTSRLYGGSWSEALLLIDEPGTPSNGMPAISSQLACNSPTGTCALTGNGTGIAYDGTAGHPNVFPGRVSVNAVTFAGVPIDPPPAGQSRILRIVNVRTDVTGVSVSPPDISTVMANISAGVLAIAGSGVTVAYVSADTTPSLRTPDDSAVSGGGALNSSAAATPQRVAILRFAAQSGSAFEARVISNPFPWTNPDAAPSPAAQNSPGMIYNTESGFYSPGLTSPLVNFATVGLADSGTRLRAQLSNIPAGATVYVSTRNVVFSNGVPSVSASPVMARLTQAEMQPFAAVTATTTLDGIPAAPLSVTNGSATAVWEVLASVPNVLSNVDFMFWVQTAAGTVSSGPVTLTAAFAPAPPTFTESDGHIASATLPEPRFSPFSTTYPLVSILNSGLAITNSPTLPNATAGFTYSQTVMVAGGTGPYTYAVTGGALPSGFSFSISGVLTGTTSQTGNFTFTVTVTDHAAATASQLFYLYVGVAPSLTIGKTHSGNFTQGQIGAKYNISVSNATGAGSPTTAVTVTETVPAGLTLISMSGTGWNCPAGGSTCTRSDALNGGATYPPILATVNVAMNASAQVTNQVSVSGGNSAPNSATDPTTILPYTSLGLGVSPAKSNLSQPVTLTANVPASATGKVTFYDGAKILGIASLSGGQASLTTRLLGPGVHPLRAHYSGDPTHGPNDTPSTTETVTSLPASAFQPEADYGAGTNPSAVAVGDFNADGVADLAVANHGSDNISILLGKGDGTFLPAVNYTVGSGPVSVAVADMNGDGKQDLVVETVTQLYVLTGNGDGTFHTNFGSAGFGLEFTVADFNGDGVADLAIVSGPANAVAILLGNGDATFHGGSTYAAGSSPLAITAADFNGDGFADLVVTNANGSTVNVLLGNGDGTFQTAVPYSVGSQPMAVVTGDFNGDGKIDIAVAYQTGGVSILLGGGDGTFQQAVNYAITGNPQSLDIGDFNGDGILDLAVAQGSGGSNSVGILMGKGDGTFQPATYTMPSSTQAIVVADFNGDGRSDLAGVAMLANTVAVELGGQPAVPGAITSPLPGSTLTSSSVTFQWSAGTATQYGLWIGSAGVGSSNLATPPSGTSTSYTATGLPTDGRTLYVRLWSLVNGNWRFNDYTYIAATIIPAAITSPANGATLTSSTVTFQWSAGTATQIGLWIGSTGVGSSNLATPPSGTATSYTATGLPTNGQTLYVRLWSLVNGAWQFNDYTYTAATAAAAITSPANGATLASSTVTFQWTSVGATQYGLWIGSTGVGSSNLATPPGGTTTSYTATGLPTDGRTLYVRLWSQVNGTWRFNDYTYTAVTISGATMTSPANHSTLTSSTVTFQWTGGATQYGLWIGSTGVGSANIAAPPVTTGTSTTVSGLPTDGRTLYVRLWALVNGSWQYNDYTYTAATFGAGTMTTPANGSTLASSSPTFTWTGGATQYGLWIGSTGVGSANIAAPPVTTGTSTTVSGLPTDGRTLYVRLWALVNGSWQYDDYSYTAATLGAGAITSPATGSTLSSSSVTFQWTGGATQYGLWVGSTGVGSANLATPPVTPGTSITVSGLPTDGRTLYVRLWSLVNGNWQFNDYSYTAPTLGAGVMTSPANGSTLSSATVTFQWTGGASQYGPWIGSTGVGSADLAAPPTTTGNSYTATGLPTDGRTLYVRLWALVNGTWSFNDYTYRAAISVP